MGPEVKKIADHWLNHVLTTGPYTLDWGHEIRLIYWMITSGRNWILPAGVVQKEKANQMGDSCNEVRRRIHHTLVVLKAGIEVLEALKRKSTQKSRTLHSLACWPLSDIQYTRRSNLMRSDWSSGRSRKKNHPSGYAAWSIRILSR